MSASYLYSLYLLKPHCHLEHMQINMSHLKTMNTVYSVAFLVSLCNENLHNNKIRLFSILYFESATKFTMLISLQFRVLCIRICRYYFVLHYLPTLLNPSTTSLLPFFPPVHRVSDVMGTVVPPLPSSMHRHYVKSWKMDM